MAVHDVLDEHHNRDVFDVAVSYCVHDMPAPYLPSKRQFDEAVRDVADDHVLDMAVSHSQRGRLMLQHHPVMLQHALARVHLAPLYPSPLTSLHL